MKRVHTGTAAFELSLNGHEAKDQKQATVCQRKPVLSTDPNYRSESCSVCSGRSSVSTSENAGESEIDVRWQIVLAAEANLA